MYKFRKSIIIAKQENYLYNCHDPIGVNLLSRLRLQFTHGYNDTVNPMCPCGAEVDTTEHFLLPCHYFFTQRIKLFANLYNLHSSFSKLNTKDKTAYLLNG